MSRGESVATARATKENKGLVTAMNEGTTEKWFAENMLPQMAMPDAQPSFAVNVANSFPVKYLIGIQKELENVKAEIRNKPSVSFGFDKAGNFFETTTSAGIQTKVIHKQIGRAHV